MKAIFKGPPSAFLGFNTLILVLMGLTFFVVESCTVGTYLQPASTNAQRVMTNVAFGDTGVVSTLAAGLAAGYNVARDSRGNLYRIEVSQSLVRRNPDGTGPVVLATGIGTNAAVCIDQFDRIFIVSMASSQLLVLNTNGVVLANPTLSGAPFAGVTCDGTNVYCVDRARSYIYVYLTNGTQVNAIFNGQNAGMQSITYDFAAGLIYFPTVDFNCIFKMQAASPFTATRLAGQPYVTGNADGAALSATFNDPAAVVGDGYGNLFIADSSNGLVRKYVASNQTVVTVAGNGVKTGVDGTGVNASFQLMGGMTIDPATGDLIVAERTAGGGLRRVTGLQTRTLVPY